MKLLTIMRKCLAFTLLSMLLASCNLSKPLSSYSATSTKPYEPPTPNSKLVLSGPTPIPTNPATNIGTPAIVIQEITPTIFKPTSTSDLYFTPTPVRYFPLTDCPASQLRPGDSAFVDYNGGVNALRMTFDTHPSDNIIGEIQPGEVVEILDGPVCNYGWVIWKVRTTRYEIGWTPETNGKDYWILPLATRQFCSNALASRLIIGGIAFVMEESNLPNRVRSGPNTSATIIDRIQPGEKMLVLDGPKCGEGGNWWFVQSLRTGITGWTMEGTTKYYLAPIP